MSVPSTETSLAAATFANDQSVFGAKPPTAFAPFPKLARLSRACFITEKIDGTNAQIFIGEDGEFLTGSRNRWITPTDDNFGFSRWAHEHKDALLLLGPGRHFGEWWGAGIQRTYGLTEKRFSLFQANRWNFLKTVTPEQNALAGVAQPVPMLYGGPFTDEAINKVMESLRSGGSVAAPGFMKAEGIVIFHAASKTCFKKTLENDETPKGLAEGVE